MSDSVWTQRWQPTRLPRPWDSPGKSAGVGCHFLLQCMKVKSESEVALSCPTLSDPMDCSLPGSSIHGIFQARVLEWGAIAFKNKGTKTKQKDSKTKERNCWFCCLLLSTQITEETWMEVTILGECIIVGVLGHSLMSNLVRNLDKNAGRIFFFAFGVWGNTRHLFWIHSWKSLRWDTGWLVLVLEREHRNVALKLNLVFSANRKHTM